MILYLPNSVRLCICLLCLAVSDFALPYLPVWFCTYLCLPYFCLSPILHPPDFVPTYRGTYICFILYLPFCLLLDMHISPAWFCTYRYLSLCLILYLPYVWFCTYLFVWFCTDLSDFVPIYLSDSRSTYLPHFVSISLSDSVSTYLSVTLLYVGFLFHCWEFLISPSSRRLSVCWSGSGSHTCFSHS